MESETDISNITSFYEIPINDPILTPIKSDKFDKYVPIDFGLYHKTLNWYLSKFFTIDYLYKFPLIQEQIDILNDILDWDILSGQDLPESIVIKYQNKINWELYLRNGFKKSAQLLLLVKDKLIENQYLFFDPYLKRLYYNPDFIESFPNLIDWKWLVKNIKLDKDQLLKFWNHFTTNDISKYQNITYEIAEKKMLEINWTLAGQNRLDEKTILFVGKNLDWNIICKYQKLSEKILNEFVNLLNWKYVSKYQRLTDDFILSNQQQLNWNEISLFQNMSLNLIRKLESKINFDNLEKNKNYNKPGTLQIIHGKQGYYIITPHNTKINYVVLGEVVTFS